MICLKIWVYFTDYHAFIIEAISFLYTSFWTGNIVLWYTKSGFSVAVLKSTEFDIKLLPKNMKNGFFVPIPLRNLISTEFDIKLLPKNMKKMAFFVPITLLTELVFPLSLYSSPPRPSTPNHQIELVETLLVVYGNDYFRIWQHLWCCWHSSMPLRKYGLRRQSTFQVVFFIHCPFVWNFVTIHV